MGNLPLGGGSGRGGGVLVERGREDVDALSLGRDSLEEPVKRKILYSE